MDLPQPVPGLGAAVLFAALRAGGQRLVLPTGQWRRLWMLALLNITSWNMLVAFGVGMILRAAPRSSRTPCRVGGAALGVAARRAHLRASSPACARPWRARAARRKLRRLGPRAARLAARARRGSFMGARHGAAEALSRAPPVGLYTAWIMLLGGVPIFAAR